jgi:hypothetical protein
MYRLPLLALNCTRRSPTTTLRCANVAICCSCDICVIATAGDALVMTAGDGGTLVDDGRARRCDCDWRGRRRRLCSGGSVHSESVKRSTTVTKHAFTLTLATLTRGAGDEALRRAALARHRAPTSSSETSGQRALPSSRSLRSRQNTLLVRSKDIDAIADRDASCRGATFARTSAQAMAAPAWPTMASQQPSRHHPTNQHPNCLPKCHHRHYRATRAATQSAPRRASARRRAPPRDEARANHPHLCSTPLVAIATMAPIRPNPNGAATARLLIEPCGETPTRREEKMASRTT